MKKKILFVLVLVLVAGLPTDVAKADFTFGTPTKVPNVNSSSRDHKPSVSADGLSLFFTSIRSGGIGGMDIWVTTRETTDDAWGEPVNLGSPINSSAWESGCISYDGLSFYFSSTRYRGSNANADIWVTTRDTIRSEWGTPMNLGPTVNSSADQCYVSISADELSLYFSSNRGGGNGRYDLWVITRETIQDPWGTPENLGPKVNSAVYEVDPGISADGRILFFASDRTGGYGGAGDIWMTTRATTDDPWGEPVNLGPTINSSASEDYPNVSADGSTLFFRYSQSGRNSSGDIWQSSIIPIVDFSGDGIVDAADMCIMVDYWGTDETLCDIGPMPWGDGIVDVQDLIVLAEHLFKEVLEVFPIQLVAYWKLDEAGGDVVYNSISDNHGILGDNPTWQPDSGQVAGALEFDGIDDYVETDFVLNPTDGTFSVFAWIKGGASEQVIISQADGIGTGETWLGITASDGNLMTGLMPYQVGRTVIFPLESQSLITDGQWHHVGFVWDGSYRHLYVNGTEVAKDTNPITLSPLIFANGGLYIGTSKTLNAGTFFSGLIDDVRIYDAALTAEQIAALAQ